MFRLLQIWCLVVLFSCINRNVSGNGEEFKSSSVLSKGKWFKMAITEDGIYRLDYSLLKQLGLEYTSNPKIFANNCGQLSYFNDRSHPDDLEEIACYIETGTDGLFNDGDYLLFYGQRTHRWVYDNNDKTFRFIRHNYSDTSFYFITSDQTKGSVITTESLSPELPDYTTDASDVSYIHELETENIIHSGREWYQPVSYSKETVIDPGFTDVINSEKIKYQLKVLARASSPTLFTLSESGNLIRNIPVNAINLTSTTGTYAQAAYADGDYNTTVEAPEFKILFSNNGELSARAWIDYVILQARCLNKFDGRTKFYNDSRSVALGNISEFMIKSSIDDVKIWDVTDPSRIKDIPFSREGNIIKFSLKTDSLRTFMAFTVKNAKIPVINRTAVPNQNLHASSDVDMIIVVNPLFREYASRLAEMHINDSGLSSVVVTPEEIYNEFSGGIPDIAAIRNFIRMKYLRQNGSEHPLKYLLLFGDGSFDNKTPAPGNTNFVPTYQTNNSNVYISSFTSDDFYGLLEDGEGEESGTEDIGIGRLPVTDSKEASVVISKISGYMNPSSDGNWKNMVSIIADDEDGNTHLYDAEGLAELIADKDPWVNVDKIYLDAFKQVTSSTGQFYPDVTQAINDRINSGTLIFNYVGHGNENSLGHERVVTPESIAKWKNISKLPLFVTATCEFSRFDDIIINSVTGAVEEKKSTGEKILLSGDGGAIALMSTTRLVYSAPNYALNRNIIDVAFDRDKNGNGLRLGDIMRIAKNRSGNSSNKRNFVLLGDPAVRLSWPWNGNIITDALINDETGTFADTLKALSLITITGHLEDPSGNKLSEFNGNIIPIVFGQERKVQTLANDGGQKVDFTIQDNVLFTGKVMAQDGDFRFTFIVPRDIDYTYGNGKISYFGSDQLYSLKGSCTDIIFGGFSDSEHTDNSGPGIRLFINDTLFRDGGITDPNPRLLAFVKDPGGINTSGTGIGHDMVCWLDNDRSNLLILNNYYENDLGSYNSGRMIYNFTGLERGRHIVTFKAWDNFNNSSEKSLSFNVEADDKLIIKTLTNYPNPFKTGTRISAEHNRTGELMKITVTIFRMNGEVIRILRSETFTNGYQFEPVEWDGCDSNGNRVGRGLYPFRLNIQTENGENAIASAIMIIY